MELEKTVAQRTSTRAVRLCRELTRWDKSRGEPVVPTQFPSFNRLFLLSLFCLLSCFLRTAFTAGHRITSLRAATETAACCHRYWTTSHIVMLRYKCVSHI